MASVVNQRLAFGNTAPHHFSYKDIVIAGGQTVVRPAFHRGDGSRQQWHAGLPMLPLDSPEPVVSLLGKSFRNFLLSIGQNVDAEVLGGAKRIDHRHLVTQANQYQRGMQRNGCKGTHRKSVGNAFCVENCSDGHAGSESPAGAAEFFTGDAMHPNLSLT